MVDNPPPGPDWTMGDDGHWKPPSFSAGGPSGGAVGGPPTGPPPVYPQGSPSPPSGYPPPGYPPSGYPPPVYPQAAPAGEGFGPAPKTDGFAIASLVLGLLCGGFLLSVVFGFVSLSRIKRSRGSLTGRGMAIAGIVLGFLFTAAWVALIVIALVFGTEKENADKFPTGDKHDIAVMFDRFEQALEDGDADEICNGIFTKDFTALLDSGSRSCREITTENKDLLQYDIIIQSIDLNGTEATVVVKENDKTLTFEVSKLDGAGEPSETGQWHVSGGMN